MSKTALVILAEGAEEMETVIVVDILRRAKVTVTLAGLTGPESVTCSRRVKIVPDCSLQDVVDGMLFDVVVLPGGGQGASSLAASEAVRSILKKHQESGKILAAVCAAPTAFLSHGIGLGKCLTSYPAFKAKLEADYKYSEDRVVVDGNLITSRGPGTCFQFALAIVQQLFGPELAQEIKGQTLASF